MQQMKAGNGNGQFKWQFCARLQLDLSAKNDGKYEQENAFNLLRH